jgi:large subunit ribosomal protein L18
MEETLVARNSRFNTPLRRRKEGRTDYKARKALLLSGKARLVARSSLNNIVAQLVVAKPSGDEISVSAHSRELLKKYGWKGSRGNLPTAYLTGLLCGLRAKALGVEEAILDIGLHPPSKGARVFAVLRGVLDAKISVPHSEDKLPDEKRINGVHVAEYAESLASDIEAYESKFSKYLSQKLRPEALPKHFEGTKMNILAEFEDRGAKN